ncbi:HEXXH motif-containing putative peptide modification protein [Amorphoplanes digitatis]|uniref:aKG-HExxH-type peptide beta-hydroxylase n=1 Tax=Actinoplanes digitatis TaxID=1868 RepID=UPI00360E944C
MSPRSPARELHHAPWRLDPRPVRSLLQGVHAHAAVTDYWAVRWRHDGSPGSGFEFAFWREVTTAAIGTLRRSAELTPAGRRLVRGMWRATEDWWRADPSPELAAAARQVTTADAVRWRLRNRGTAPDLPESLKDSLLRGERCPVLPPPIVQQADPEPARHTRIGAAVRRSALRGAPSEDGDELDTWRATVAADPDDEEAWAALAHQLTLRGRGPAATALIERPEIVRAVLLAGRADPAATEHRDPVRIAAWVAEGDDQVGDTPDSAQYYR